MSVWTPIFKAGTHTDSAGQTRLWTTGDLDRAVETYDPGSHAAPLVIGHPRTDSPAWGWVKELRRDGDVLLARMDQVPERLKQAVAAGHYRHKSAAFYGDGSLRHVGLLGATPPAVKGLGPVEFSGGDDWQEWSFSEGSEQTPEGTMNEVDQLKAEVAELKAKAQAAEDARTKAEAHAEAKKTRAAKDREAKFAELVADGKCLPAEKDVVLAIAAELDSGAELTFAEGGTVVNKQAVDAFWALLDGRPANELQGEFAEEPGEGDGQGEACGNFAAKF